MIWFITFCTVLVLIILLLMLKIFRMHRGIDEVCTEFCERLKPDTNTLITTSSGDRHIKQLASQINSQLLLLKKERRRLKVSDLELKESITSISHDLRTPLTAISGYLNLLMREEHTEETLKYLKIIQNRSDTLTQLTEELFRYFTVTSAPDDIVYENLSLNAALEEILSAYYAALTNRQMIPRISMPESAVYRKLNAGILNRILENIMSNVLKYSSGDLKIILSETGEITFSNSAPGLNELEARKLFDRYYTVSAASKSTGLGLSIAKELTEKLHGTITSNYADGKLNIIIYFPCLTGES